MSRKWFVVDSKHPWRSIRTIEADVASGEKLAWIQYPVKDGYRPTMKRNIVGMTAFPFMSGAIASQNQRCRDMIRRCGTWWETINAVEACLKRLEKNGEPYVYSH